VAAAIAPLGGRVRTGWALGLLLAAAAPAAAQPAPARVIDVAAYRDELRAAEAALVAHALPEAAERGTALATTRVAYAGETVGVDPALAVALRTVRPETAAAALTRVRAVLRALPAEAAGAPRAPDAALLRRAQAAERRPDIPEGGEVAGLAVRPSLPRRFLDALGSAWSAVRDALIRFGQWLRRLWPRRAATAAPAATFSTTVMVVALVALVSALLGWLAVAALRRSRRATAVSATPEAASARDEDPLSREQDEWEAYAGELARAGRLREAIRAWYHAVLVALFRSGLLHHQKGRTNWEYVSRVPPEASWRAGLSDLTRRFDREWYGREKSSPESLGACASAARAILAEVRGGGPA